MAQNKLEIDCAFGTRINFEIEPDCECYGRELLKFTSNRVINYYRHGDDKKNSCLFI